MLPKFVFQNTITYIHVASKHSQPTLLMNWFTHLNMMQFLSFFKIKWLYPLNTQEPTFCAQVKKIQILQAKANIVQNIVEVSSTVKYVRGQDQTRARNVMSAVVVSQWSNLRAKRGALGRKYTNLKKCSQRRVKLQVSIDGEIWRSALDLEGRMLVMMVSNLLSLSGMLKKLVFLL